MNEENENTYTMYNVSLCIYNKTTTLKETLLIRFTMYIEKMAS